MSGASLQPSVKDSLLTGGIASLLHIFATLLKVSSPHSCLCPHSAPLVRLSPMFDADDVTRMLLRTLTDAQRAALELTYTYF